jgi:hypothetical protein
MTRLNVLYAIIPGQHHVRQLGIKKGEQSAMRPPEDDLETLECPHCGAELQLNIQSEVCICDLCVALMSHCQCGDCNMSDCSFNEAKECKYNKLKENK